jgi:hypothetical protein
MKLTDANTYILRCTSLLPAARPASYGLISPSCSPGYWCDCGAPGYIAPADQQSCNTCRNPCEFGDPCNSNYDARNVCVVYAQTHGLTHT